MVGDQLDARFVYIIRLFQGSTCFEQTHAHHQEVNCINTASGIVILCKWPSGMQVEQVDAHFFYIIRLFQSSTCFEQTRAHYQEVNCITTASGMVTLCKWPAGMHVEQELYRE